MFEVVPDEDVLVRTALRSSSISSTSSLNWPATIWSCGSGTNPVSGLGRGGPMVVSREVQFLAHLFVYGV
jgi:hypothetical protein